MTIPATNPLTSASAPIFVPAKLSRPDNKLPSGIISGGVAIETGYGQKKYMLTAQSNNITDGPPRNSLINFLSSDFVHVGDLNWWTSVDDIVSVARRAGLKLDVKDVVFAAHNVNGKSKGNVTINCRSPERASALVHWLHYNDVQGKRLRPSYVTGQNQAKTAPPRPIANLGLTAPFATNAHGGINFNRLRPHNRVTGHQTYNNGSAQHGNHPHYGPAPAHGQCAHNGMHGQFNGVAGQSKHHGNVGMGVPKSGLFHKIATGKLHVHDPVQGHGNWQHGFPGLEGQQGGAQIKSHHRERQDYGSIASSYPYGYDDHLDHN